MTDSLGQSQVMPYLSGLSQLKDNNGNYLYQFYLISCEKKSFYSKEFHETQIQLSNSNIQWLPLSYTSKPPVLSTIWDIIKLIRRAKIIHKKEKIQIVHCRSYIAAHIGLFLKKKFNISFIFDMRGFYADERIEGGLWNIKNPLYNCIYRYFKKKEKQFLSNADYTISLTENAKNEILSWPISIKNIPIKVIPCCADLDLFNKNKITDTERKACFSKLRIPQDKLILSYLGSIGTWYLLDEMLDFFYVLKEQIKDAKFLFITPDKPETIINKAIAKNIPAEDIIIQKASRQEVPILLSISTVSLFFIKPVYSKKASSPTKMGEIMGMGIPIICNKNIGDIDTIMNNKSGIFLLSDFNITEYERISSTISTLIKTPSEEIREMADTYFSLKNGIQKYKEVYDYLTK